uniref:Stress associated endoplasmic reticulum protein n=1 Tax=Solanum tuberosum TaxID=4113 RepID=M1D7X8_SOLTU
MTTKTKNPSKIGPTGYWLPFFAVVSGTAPRLVIFFSNLSTFLSARRLDVVWSNATKQRNDSQQNLVQTTF